MPASFDKEKGLKYLKTVGDFTLDITKKMLQAIGQITKDYLNEKKEDRKLYKEIEKTEKMKAHQRNMEAKWNPRPQTESVTVRAERTMPNESLPAIWRGRKVWDRDDVNG